MSSKDFCPECGIGLNSREINMGFCQNCKAHWKTEWSKVKCDLCSYEWTAIRPAIGLAKLECPKCSNMVYFENVE